MKNKKNIFAIVLIIVSLLIIIFIGLYFLIRFSFWNPSFLYKSVPDNSITVKGRGFSFQYPVDWYVIEGSPVLESNKQDIYLILDPPSEEPNPFDDIRIYSNEDTLANIREMYNHDYDGLTNIIIDGHQGVYYGDMGLVTYATYAIQIDDKHLLFLSTDESLDELNQVLNTIHFD